MSITHVLPLGQEYMNRHVIFTAGTLSTRYILHIMMTWVSWEEAMTITSIHALPLTVFGKLG